jgi:hypothetical protein
MYNGVFTVKRAILAFCIQGVYYGPGSKLSVLFDNPQSRRHSYHPYGDALGISVGWAERTVTSAQMSVKITNHVRSTIFNMRQNKCISKVNVAVQ